MKKLNALALAGLTLLFMACAEEKPETPENTNNNPEGQEEAAPVAVTYGIDAANSTVNWTGEMLGMYSHSGTINISDGSVTLTGDEVTSAKILVDMTSISPTDENYDEEKTPDMLVGHLSSEDFFAVESHPTATFVMEGAGTGTLTVRGVSNAQTVEDVAVTKNEDGSVAITGTMTFDRKKHEVAFDHPAQEMIISDDVTLTFNISAVGK